MFFQVVCVVFKENSVVHTITVTTGLKQEPFLELRKLNSFFQLCICCLLEMLSICSQLLFPHGLALTFSKHFTRGVAGNVLYRANDLNICVLTYSHFG